MSTKNLHAHSTEKTWIGTIVVVLVVGLNASDDFVRVFFARARAKQMDVYRTTASIRVARPIWMGHEKIAIRRGMNVKLRREHLLFDAMDGPRVCVCATYKWRNCPAR